MHAPLPFKPPSSFGERTELGKSIGDSALARWAFLSTELGLVPIYDIHVYSFSSVTASCNKIFCNSEKCSVRPVTKVAHMTTSREHVRPNTFPKGNTFAADYRPGSSSETVLTKFWLVKLPVYAGICKWFLTSIVEAKT